MNPDEMEIRLNDGESVIIAKKSTIAVMLSTLGLVFWGWRSGKWGFAVCDGMDGGVKTFIKEWEN